MKIQTRLILLVFLLVAMFIVGLIFLKYSEREKVSSIFRDKEQEKIMLFDKIVKLKGSSLEMFAYDYTFWDEMISFVKTGNKYWAYQNIEVVLKNFNVHAVWVYRTDFSLVYSTNTSENDSLKEIPLPKGAFKKLFARGYFNHFFVNTPKGLMEIRGTPIQPSDDNERKTPPQGLFFAGRLWTEGYIDELSNLTQNIIRVLPIGEETSEGNHSRESGVITISRTLSGWDGSPLMRIYAQSEFPLIKELIRSSNRQFVLLTIFVSAFLIFFSVFLLRWVNNPLRLISKSLHAEDPTIIKSLQNEKTEFGQLSVFIYRFFEQRGNLIKEITERKRVEEELNKRNKDLEILNTITLAVHQSLNLREVYRVALDKVIELENVDLACIYLVDEGKNEAVIQDYRNFPEEFVQRAGIIPYPKGVTWKVINTGKIVNVKNAQENPDVGPAGRELGFRSMLGIPIILEGKATGVIWLLSYREYLYTRYEEELLVSIGNQIATAIGQARLYEKEYKQRERVEALQVVSQSVTSKLDYRAVLQEVVENTNRLMISRFSIIALPEGDYFFPKAVAGEDEGLRDVIQICSDPKNMWGQGRGGECIRTKAPVVAFDLRNDPPKIWRTELIKRGILSVAIVPLIIKNEVEGLLLTYSAEPYAFDRDKINLLSSFANQAAIAIENSRLYEETKKQTDRLRALYEDLNKRNKDLEILNTVTQAVHQSINLEETYNIALELTTSIENVDMAMIYLVDEGRKEAVLQATRNVPEDYLQRAGRIPYPKGITWKVISTGEIMNVEDAQKDPHIGPAGRDLGHHSVLGIPITLEDVVIGVIWFISYKERQFVKQEIDLLSSIGNQIAVAIAKAKLYGELSKKNRYESIISTVTRSVHQSTNLQEVLENAVETMSKNMDGVDNVCVYVVEGEEADSSGSPQAVMKAYRGYPDWFIERVRRIPYPKGFTWRTIIDGEPRYCADVDQDTVIGLAGREMGTKSYASMPIRFEGKTIGCININSLEKNAFNEEELKLLEIVARQVVLAINNAKQTEALKESEERYRNLVETARDIIYTLSPDGTITTLNPVSENITGWSMDEWLGKQSSPLLHPEDLPFVKELFQRVLQGESLPLTEMRILAKNGKYIVMESTATPQILNGKVVGVLGIARDVTERKRMEDAIRQSEERLTYIINNTPNVAIEGFDMGGRVLYWNKAAENIFGWTKEQALGKTLDQLILDKESAERFNSILKEISETNQPFGPSEWKYINGEGNEGTVYSTIFPIPSSDGKMEFICMDIDITERKVQEEKIHYMAMHDSLTDLPNRRALQEKLESIFKQPKLKGTHGLVVMDLDNFKIINDTLGHLEGDRVLIDLAGILRNTMRPSDLLARVGGDEFAMILQNVNRDEAKAIASRFYKAINGYSFYLKGNNFQIGISLGISMIEYGSESDIIISSAYSALAKAKYEGKNRIVVYGAEDYKEVEYDQATQWGIRINDALKENRFSLYFQPVVHMDSGKTEYVEALVRLNEGSEIIIHPKAFLPAAERFGLMSKIDRWVVEKAMSLLSDINGLRLFINLSGSSLRDQSLLDLIEDSLKSNPKISKQLGFEITEFTNIPSIERAREWMNRIKDLGCQFALDDFGMGYSSFAHLVSLPVDYVKIEGSFIRGLSTDPTIVAIVKAIITVSNVLGKQVIAEGVETNTVAKLLKKLNVKYGQGNLWQAPDKERLTFS